MSSEKMNRIYQYIESNIEGDKISLQDLKNALSMDLPSTAVLKRKLRERYGDKFILTDLEMDLPRRLVSEEQFHILLDFMREHPELAKGTHRGRQGKMISYKKWAACAKKLNAVKDGAIKDGKGWSKYWCDWKYRARRHALGLKIAKDQNPSEDKLPPLSSFEEKIMSILGDSSIDGLVVKSDPLGDEDCKQANCIQTDEVTTQHLGTKKRRSKCLRIATVAVKNNVSKSPESEADYFNDEGDQLATEDDTEESESEDEKRMTRKFLRLEKLQLESSKKIQKSVSEMTAEVRKLSQIMSEIRDALVKRLDST